MSEGTIDWAVAWEDGIRETPSHQLICDGRMLATERPGDSGTVIRGSGPIRPVLTIRGRRTNSKGDRSVPAGKCQHEQALGHADPIAQHGSSQHLLATARQVIAEP
jgi:hypothetical protein